jgi:hypothetical protein
MIRVTIELITPKGEQSIIGRMFISNRGNVYEDKTSDYSVCVLRRGQTKHPLLGGKTTRTGEVLRYKREVYNVWRLIIRALKSAFPEER